MATAWQTLEEAALTLGISSRTLHRRIAKGEFQTRLENGRREVLVSIAEPQIDGAQLGVGRGAANVSDAAADAVDVIGAGSGREGGELSADVQSTMLMLHEDRIRRTDLALMAYQQSVNVSAINARQARISSRVAWGTAGALAAMLFVCVTWATHRVTKAQADMENLNGQVKQLSTAADMRQQEADRLRLDVEIARVASARTEGQLTAAQAQIAQAESGGGQSQGGGRQGAWGVGDERGDDGAGGNATGGAVGKQKAVAAALSDNSILHVNTELAVGWRQWQPS